jgi:hypothetical protein
VDPTAVEDVSVHVDSPSPRLQPNSGSVLRPDARLSRTRVEPGQSCQGVSTARLFLCLLNRACSTNKKTAQRRPGCQRLHFINKTTGKLLGQKEK